MGITNKKKLGFTLIELILAMSVFAVTLPVVFGLFFLNLQTRTKVLILQQVKRNGDDALAIIDGMVHTRGYSIYSDQAMTIKDPAGTQFYFALDNGKIASYSASMSPNPAYLTNSKVEVSSFSISCERSATFSPPLVSISFVVSQLGSPVRHEERASLNYQTKTKLQNYQ